MNLSPLNDKMTTNKPKTVRLTLEDVQSFVRSLGSDPSSINYCEIKFRDDGGHFIELCSLGQPSSLDIAVHEGYRGGHSVIVFANEINGRFDIIIEKPLSDSYDIKFISIMNGVCNITADRLDDVSCIGRLTTGSKIIARSIGRLTVYNRTDIIACLHITGQVMTLPTTIITEQEMRERYFAWLERTKQEDLLKLLHMLHHRWAKFTGITTD
jgi:hypothetical protein